MQEFNVEILFKSLSHSHGEIICTIGDLVLSNLYIKPGELEPLTSDCSFEVGKFFIQMLASKLNQNSSQPLNPTHPIISEKTLNELEKKFNYDPYLRYNRETSEVVQIAYLKLRFASHWAQTNGMHIITAIAIDSLYSRNLQIISYLETRKNLFDETQMEATNSNEFCELVLTELKSLSNLLAIASKFSNLNNADTLFDAYFFHHLYKFEILDLVYFDQHASAYGQLGFETTVKAIYNQVDGPFPAPLIQLSKLKKIKECVLKYLTSLEAIISTYNLPQKNKDIITRLIEKWNFIININIEPVISQYYAHIFEAFRIFFYESNVMSSLEFDAHIQNFSKKGMNSIRTPTLMLIDQATLNIIQENIKRIDINHSLFDQTLQIFVSNIFKYFSLNLFTREFVKYQNKKELIDYARELTLKACSSLCDHANSFLLSSDEDQYFMIRRIMEKLNNYLEVTTGHSQKNMNSENEVDDVMSYTGDENADISDIESPQKNTDSENEVNDDMSHDSDENTDDIIDENENVESVLSKFNSNMLEISNILKHINYITKSFDIILYSQKAFGISSNEALNKREQLSNYKNTLKDRLNLFKQYFMDFKVLDGSTIETPASDAPSSLLIDVIKHYYASKITSIKVDGIFDFIDEQTKISDDISQNIKNKESFQDEKAELRKIRSQNLKPLIKNNQKLIDQFKEYTNSKDCRITFAKRLLDLNSLYLNNLMQLISELTGSHELKEQTIAILASHLFIPNINYKFHPKPSDYDSDNDACINVNNNSIKH